MRHGQQFDYEGLREKAKQIVDDSDKKRKDVAQELGVSPGSVSSALNGSGAKYASLQKRIIEHLTPYRVVESITFTTLRMGK